MKCWVMRGVETIIYLVMVLERREWNMGRNSFIKDVSRSFLKIADLCEELGINLTFGDVVITEKNKR